MVLPFEARAAQGKLKVHRRYLSFSRPFDFSKGLNVSAIQPVNSLRVWTHNDVGQFIPSDIAPTEDGGIVAARILDHSLSNFFNSPAVRNSDIGRTATKVEKSMEGSVSFGSKKPKSTQHNVKFAMRAAQTKAQLEYTGYTKAQVSYSIAESKIGVEIREDLPTLNTQLVLNHSDIINGQKIDMLSLSWGW